MAKVLLSIDSALLRQIDRAAKARGLTRSAYIAHLASRDSNFVTGPGATTTARRAMARLDEMMAATPVADSTDVIRAERDSH